MDNKTESQSEAVSQVQPAVRFSRHLRPTWVFALGTSVSVGLGIYILLGIFVQEAGQQTVGLPYLLLAIVAIPFILTTVERLGVIPGSGGLYNLARRTGRVGLTYGSGWLLLGGYIGLLALLGWGAALHVNLFSDYFFNQPLDLSVLATAVIALLALNSILGARGDWRARRTYVYLAVIVLLIVITRDLFRPAQPEQTTITWLHSTNRVLHVTALMAVSWWGLQFILNTRDEVHRPAGTLLRAMSMTVAAAAGLGLLVGLSLFLYGAVPTTLTPLIEILGEVGLIPKGLLVALYAAFGLLISLIAFNQGLVHSLRLVGDMTRDGFLPVALQAVSPRYNVSPVLIVPIAGLSILLIVLMPVVTLVGFSALIILWVAALVYLPEAFTTIPNLPEKRFPNLPFHPLFPWLVIAIGVFLPFYLDRAAWWPASGWILIGLLYYLVFARRGGLAVHRQEVVVEDQMAELADYQGQYVVMVGLANPKTAFALLQTGARLAQARKGILLALKVITQAEQIPTYLKRQSAQKEWESLSRMIQQVGLEEGLIRPIVRLAPNPSDGIIAAVREGEVDLLLLGWERDSVSDDMPPDSVLDPVIKHAPCEVAIMRGSVPSVVKRVLVPTSGGSYAAAALSLGQDLGGPEAKQINVETMIEEQLTPEREAQAKADVKTILATVPTEFQINQRVLEVDDVKTSIITQAKAADLLLIGASKQGFPERPFFGGLAAEIATSAAPPTILSRGRELERSWWQRLWETLTDVLPTLTLARQAEVYQNMRESAQPSVDFFVLITLSAVIASLGLLQNSAAVIIGAMLVAPLMSPILAIGMGMVHGNLRLLLVAAEATAKGVALAIMVGVVMVIISPIETATPEILARTSPNLLDLLIALASGAAAGYAISRKEVAAALPGVAIAAALVPPLCVVGYGLGTSQLDIASGSLLLFITNLIAIVLAAGLTFLALGFHPTRAEQQEVMRGLKVTVVSFAIISIILALTTMVVVIQLNREVNVEKIFTNEVVARAGQVREIEIKRDGDGFIITATIIDIEGNQLTSAQIAEMQDQLTEAVGGPVTIQATVIPGTEVDLTDFDQRRQLETLFIGEMVEQGAEVIDMTVEELQGGFTITAIVMAFEDDALPDETIAEIQADLSQEMGTPVTIQTKIIPARQVNITPPDPATPTPEP